MSACTPISQYKERATLSIEILRRQVDWCLDTSKLSYICAPVDR